MTDQRTETYEDVRKARRFIAFIGLALLLLSQILFGVASSIFFIQFFLFSLFFKEIFGNK